MNILITGGLGFIGSNFINYIFSNDKFSFNKLINIDKESYCSNYNPINVKSEKYKYIKADINNKNFISFILKEYNITHIIHFAAQSHVDNSFDNSLDYTTDNVRGTHILLDCVKNVNKDIVFIHFSTDEVYGESIDKDDIKTENNLLLPTNPYAASKAAAEMYVNSYKKSYNLKTIILRCNNVFGLNQYPEKVIPKFIKQINENKKITIHGKGESIRDFIYVDDVTEAILVIINKGKIGEIYNISGEIKISIIDLAKLIIKKEDYENYIEYVDDRPFNDKRYEINSDKLKNLGWKVKMIDLMHTADVFDGLVE
jgi:dTDP-glucose 4,6-dehydratase|tara:strand:+ start:884 stop:1822 length:939 start_codon:yes stop_codon:yes gene_type:complete